MFLGVFRVNVKTQKNESVAAILILMVIHKVLNLYCLVLDFPFFVFLFSGDSCNSELNGNVWYWHVYIFLSLKFRLFGFC